MGTPGGEPGARENSGFVAQGNNIVWMFGGAGNTENATGVWMNDLWSFNMTTAQWTWVSGNPVGNGEYRPIFGTQGTPAPANLPGSMASMSLWVDNAANIFVYGGEGYDATQSFGDMSDLWKFDGTNWTWVTGPGVRNVQASYGAAAMPGGRIDAATWIDTSHNLWLFGGLAESGVFGNDMWMFDGTSWTWMGGGKITSTAQFGNYGTQNKVSASNQPGARYSSATWRDSTGNLWLFGGWGLAATQSSNLLSDMWMYVP
jgi:N-acetylneuraminic acid mutarotase